MIDADLCSEGFLTAFKALSKEQRQIVLAGIAADEQCAEDLIDIARIVDRREEPSRPFLDYLAEKQS